MKKYNKPIIIEEEIKILDVIAESFGTSQAGDKIVNFLED
jgi:hypothetical protein